MSRPKAVFLISLALLACSDASAQSDELATRLTEAMRYGKAFDDATKECRDRVSTFDYEAALRDTPELFGGIRPGDPFWEEAKVLYSNLLRESCGYDKAAAENAFAKTLAKHLSPSEMQSVLDFYKSEIGQSFVQASLEANDAANRASSPDINSNKAYRAYEEGLGELLRRRAQKEVRNPVL